MRTEDNWKTSKVSTTILKLKENHDDDAAKTQSKTGTVPAIAKQHR